MKRKKILMFGILLLIVIMRFNFVFAQYQGSFGEDITIESGEGIDLSLSEMGANAYFRKPGSFVEINGNRFENIKDGWIQANEKGEITSARFFTDEKFGEYNFNGNLIKVPPNSEIAFFVIDGRNVFTGLPENTEIKNIKTTAEFEGKNLKFWKDNKQYDFSGNLNFRENGQIYINKKDSLEFKGIEIEKPGKEIDLFLDGKIHEESKNYISFGKNDFRFKNSDLDLVPLYLNKDFSYLKIGEGDKAFLPTRGSEIVIQKRDEFGLDPLLRAKLLSSSGIVYLINGKEGIALSGNKFFLSRESGGASFPLEFINQNSNEKILIDNSGRINVVKEIEEGIGRFQRVRYEYLTEESTEKLIGKEIVFGGLSEAEKTNSLQNLKNYWGNLNYETRESINKIEILSSKEFDDYYPFFKVFGAFPGAFASPTGTIVMRSGYESSLKHEAAHERHYDLGLIPGLSYGGEFNKKWDKTAGEYDKVISTKHGDYYKDASGEIILEPRHGYTSAYGGKNIHEDVATFVDYSNNPEFFKPLIDPTSEKYDKRYRQKLDLLYKYKFITDKEYYRILREAGVQ
ncbi:MAG: hypothetical protein Q8O84_04530 [Nanoarchaeota archaeon]|nr:hypothetical protein [Nanoarchaeota archaeon]